MKSTILIHSVLIYSFTLIGPLNFSSYAENYYQRQQHNNVFKWKDKDGVIHYGQKPPSTEEDVDITILNVEKGTPVTKPNSSSEDQTEASEKEDAPQKNVPIEDPKILAENCDKANQNIEILTKFTRVREKNESGEYRYLSDEERQKRLDRFNNYFKGNCE